MHLAFRVSGSDAALIAACRQKTSSASRDHEPIAPPAPAEQTPQETGKTQGTMERNLRDNNLINNHSWIPQVHVTRHERSHEHETAENMPCRRRQLCRSHVRMSLPSPPGLRPVARHGGGAPSPAAGHFGIVSCHCQRVRRQVNVLRQRIRRKDDTTQCQKWARRHGLVESSFSLTVLLCSKVESGAFSSLPEKRRRVHREKEGHVWSIDLVVVVGPKYNVTNSCCMFGQCFNGHKCTRSG